MKKLLYILSGLLIASTAFAATPPLNSNQLSPTPVNGYVLQTDGQANHWVATSTLGISGGSGAVSSVFGRTGAVVATAGDYTTAMVTEATNLYFTAARVLATTLAGFSATTGTVTSSDTVLSAIDKLAGNAANYLSNITGLVTAGTNVTITGSGTAGSPYVINSTATGGAAYPFPLAGNATSTLTQFFGGLLTNTIQATSTATSTITNFGGILAAIGFPGADMGAQINAAYAALPSNGGQIVVPSGTYNFSTPIAFTTNNKPATLVGTPGGSTVLNFTPTSGTAITVNSGDSPIQAGYGVQRLNLTGAGGTSIGIYVGGTNGAPDSLFDSLRVTGFGTGFETGNNVWLMNVTNSIFIGNTTDLATTGTTNAGENFKFVNDTFADCTSVYKCVNIGTSTTASLAFTNASFDDAQLYVADGNEAVNITGGHFENPYQIVLGQYDYIELAPSSSSGYSSMTITGSNFYQDATTTAKAPNQFILNGGHLVLNNVSSASNGAVVPAFVGQVATGNQSLEVFGIRNIANASFAVVSTSTINFLSDAANNLVSAGTRLDIGTTSVKTSVLNVVGPAYSISGGDEYDAFVGDSARNGLAFGWDDTHNWVALHPVQIGVQPLDLDIGSPFSTASSTIFKANGNVGIASTSPGSLLSIGTTNGINFSTATSTFSSTGGINLTKGCYAVNGVCISGGGATYTAGTGLTLTGGAFSVNTSQNISTLSNLTTAGFVQTTSGGVLSSAALTSGQITTALGFTPYNATNPSGYISNITGLLSAGTNVSVTGSGTSGSPYVINSTGGSSFGYPFPSNATSTLLTFSGGATIANNLTLSGITGSTQCLTVNSSGVVSGTGSACGSGGGSGTVGTGTTGQFPYYAANGTTLTATSSLFLAASGNVGIASTTPYGQLAITRSSSAPALNIYNNAAVNSAGYMLYLSDNYGDNAYFDAYGSLHDTTVGLGNSNPNGSVAAVMISNVSTPVALVVSTGNVGIGTSTPGSLLSVQGIANFTAATSTFESTGGLNLTAGCYAVNGTCIGTGGGGGYSPIGTTGQFPYFSGTNTLTATSSLFLATNGFVGIGTTTPTAPLTIQASTLGGFLLQTFTNITNAFTIKNAAGNTVFNIDTTAANPFLGIGTSTPFATLSVVGDGTDPVFAVATTTNNGLPNFEIDSLGHRVTSGSKPTLSACGTSPTVIGNDNNGTITAGSGSASACTITFAKAWTTAPSCVATAGAAITADITTLNTTTLTMGFSGSIVSSKIYYVCDGTQ